MLLAILDRHVAWGVAFLILILYLILEIALIRTLRTLVAHATVVRVDSHLVILRWTVLVIFLELVSDLVDVFLTGSLGVIVIYAHVIVLVE